MTQLAEAGLDPGEVLFDRSWWSGPGAHGGLLVAEAVRHAAAALDLGAARTLRSVSVQLLSAVGAAPVRMIPSLLRTGGSATSVSLRAEQDGELRLVGHAVFGLSRPGPVTVTGIPGPAGALGPEQAMRAPVAGGPAFTRHMEYRSADGSWPLAGGDQPILTAWIRRREPVAVDAAEAVFLLDAMAPGVYGQLTEPVPVPTLDYTVHIHAPLDDDPLPTGAWVLAQQRCVAAGEGWAVDEGTLWGESGHLLATARQLRRVL